MNELVKPKDLSGAVMTREQFAEIAQAASSVAFSPNTLSERKVVKVITGVEFQGSNVIQLNIDNNGEGAAAQKLRIGSRLALAEMGSMYGIGKGAIDNDVITDQFGAGCKKANEVTAMAISNPMIVQEIRIKSDDATQLTAGLAELSLRTDLTVDKTLVDLSGDENMDDQRANLIVIRPKKSYGWVLSSTRGLEFEIVADATCSIFLKIASQSNTSELASI